MTTFQVVNGYVCRDCTDVLRAKRGVDPAHPQDGPGGRGRALKTESAHAAAPALATSGDIGTRLHVVA